MDLKVHTNTFKLVQRISNTSEITKTLIPFAPQKAEYTGNGEILQPFERVSPESENIPSQYIDSFINSIYDNKSLELHNIIILHNGKIIREQSFGAYNMHIWHITHSMCKTITGLAIGMLIDEKLITLDTKIVDIFKKKASLTNQLFSAVTVRNLLSMSSGVVFGESGAVTETHWIRAYLESALKYEPGKKFSYNSMNSYILSAAVKEITGQGLTEYLTPRLFEPLGIRDIYWEKSPEGIEKGGWGLYIMPEDCAKLGMLFMQKGMWNGNQLVSKGWVRRMTATHKITPSNGGIYNYGYHVWVSRDKQSYLFNGMFGQNVFVFPENKFVIVTNSGNGEVLQQSDLYDIVNDYFGKTFGLVQLYNPVNAVNFKNCDTRSAFCDSEYIIDIKSCGYHGILPLIAQALQNNYTQGIHRVKFTNAGNQITVSITEGNETYCFPVSGKPYYDNININGEIYNVGVTGIFTANEDNVPVLKLNIDFTELPNTRIIKIFMYGNMIEIKMSENPGYRFIKKIINAPDLSNIARIAVAKIEKSYLEFKAEKAFEPIMKGDKLI